MVLSEAAGPWPRRMPVTRQSPRYDQIVAADPLKSALEELTPGLDPELKPLAAALLGDEPVEDAWAALLQEILDEA
jgi:hypothetical protein